MKILTSLRSFARALMIASALHSGCSAAASDQPYTRWQQVLESYDIFQVALRGPEELVLAECEDDPGAVRVREVLFLGGRLVPLFLGRVRRGGPPPPAGVPETVDGYMFLEELGSDWEAGSWIPGTDGRDRLVRRLVQKPARSCRGYGFTAAPEEVAGGGSRLVLRDPDGRLWERVGPRAWDVSRDPWHRLRAAGSAGVVAATSQDPRGGRWLVGGLNGRFVLDLVGAFQGTAAALDAVAGVTVGDSGLWVAGASGTVLRVLRRDRKLTVRVRRLPGTGPVELRGNGLDPLPHRDGVTYALGPDGTFRPLPASLEGQDLRGVAADALSGELFAWAAAGGVFRHQRATDSWRSLPAAPGPVARLAAQGRELYAVLTSGRLVRLPTGDADARARALEALGPWQQAVEQAPVEETLELELTDAEHGAQANLRAFLEEVWSLSPAPYDPCTAYPIGHLRRELAESLHQYLSGGPRSASGERRARAAVRRDMLLATYLRARLGISLGAPRLTISGVFGKQVGVDLTARSPFVGDRVEVVKSTRLYRRTLARVEDPRQRLVLELAILQGEADLELQRQGRLAPELQARLREDADGFVSAALRSQSPSPVVQRVRAILVHFITQKTGAPTGLPYGVECDERPLATPVDWRDFGRAVRTRVPAP